MPLFSGLWHDQLSAAHAVALAVGPFDSEAAAFVEQTFGYLLEAVGHLPEVRIDNVAPFLHAFRDELWQIVVFDLVTLGHLSGVVDVDERRGGAIISRLFIVMKVNGNGEYFARGKSGVDFHHDGLVFIRTHHVTA